MTSIKANAGLTVINSRKSKKTRAKTIRYSQSLANKLCAEIARGNSLRKTCEQPGMPAIRTVYYWFSKHPELLLQYAHAKDASADSDQDRLDEIAEQVIAGTLCERRARVAADIIKWSASKKMPKKYGDRIQQDVRTSDYDSMDDQQLERELAVVRLEYDRIKNQDLH